MTKGNRIHYVVRPALDWHPEYWALLRGTTHITDRANHGITFVDGYTIAQSDTRSVFVVPYGTHRHIGLLTCIWRASEVQEL